MSKNQIPAHQLMISYQTCGDYLLKPFGLRLVIEVNTAHQVISCHKKGSEDIFFFFLWRYMYTQVYNRPHNNSSAILTL